MEINSAILVIFSVKKLLMSFIFFHYRFNISSINLSEAAIYNDFFHIIFDSNVPEV